MDTLASLTETARQAATAYETLERHTVEARREQVLIYGRALRAIRQQLPDNHEFGRYLVANQLDVRNKIWRSDAMWFADLDELLRKSLTRCPYSHPTDIRKWMRKQDPNRQPKQTPIRRAVRDHVRERIERNEPISVEQVIQETGRDRRVVEAAIAAERGRIEGREQAPVDIHKLADAMGLDETSKAKLRALDDRLRRQYEGTYEDRVTEGVRQHIKDKILPEYNRMWTAADERLKHYRTPLTPAEYNTLIWALHEDQTDAARRAEAFALVHRLRVVLRGPEGEVKPRSMPWSLAEMVARRRRPAA